MNLSAQDVREYIVEGRVPNEAARQACVAIIDRILTKSRGNNFMGAMRSMDKGAFALLLMSFVKEVREAGVDTAGAKLDRDIKIKISQDDLDYASQVAQTTGLGVNELLGLLLQRVLFTIRRYDA